MLVERGGGLALGVIYGEGPFVMIIDTGSQDHVLRGAAAQTRNNLAITARLLSEDIAELRSSGGIPAHVRTVVSALIPQRVLVIEIFGLSRKADPQRRNARAVMMAIFELVSAHNIVALDNDGETLFSQRILVVDTDGRPYAGLVGAAMGAVEPMFSDERQ